MLNWIINWSLRHRLLVLGEPERGWAEADRAVDRATRRFGASAVRPGSLF